MSRQFDESMVGKFELFGETYELVEPHNFEELMQALRVKEVIQTGISGLMHDEDPSSLLMLMEEQNGFIGDYLNSIGEFDNRFLISNISFLAKKNNLRIGEIESMLGLSAGYISRTSKENSAKKLSIDVVWKIARLFEVDIKLLLETDLQVPDSNSDLAMKFIAKVFKETESCLIEWQCNGGVSTVLHESFSKAGLITHKGEITYYHPMSMNRDVHFILADDIFACESIAANSEVIIVPYYFESSSEKYRQYESILRYSVDDENDQEYGAYRFARMFTTGDDPFSDLQNDAEKLYELIKDREFDTRMSARTKTIISDYLKS